MHLLRPIISNFLLEYVVFLMKYVIFRLFSGGRAGGRAGGLYKAPDANRKPQKTRQRPKRLDSDPKGGTTGE